MRKKNTTYSDIAAYTQLSKMTVSRYFNQPDSLAAETRDKIQAALSELNYMENKFAKGLACGRTGMLGIITPTFFYNFYSYLVSSFLNVSEESGYKFLLYIGNGSQKSERQCINDLLSYRIEGLIVLSHPLLSKELRDYNLPIVSIEREAAFISSVDTDNYFGAKKAVEQLIVDQCDAIVHINSPTKPDIPAYQRIQAFYDVCKKYKLPNKVYYRDIIANTQKLYLVLDEVCEEISKDFPDKRVGIFATNDTVANILVNCLLRRGIKIPEQYEVIGFDNSPICEESILPITTVAQNAPKIVSNCIDLLQQQINSQKKDPDTLPDPKHIVIKPKLILRSTTLNKRSEK